jgi:hypothetical protein
VKMKSNAPLTKTINAALNFGNILKPPLLREMRPLRAAKTSSSKIVGQTNGRQPIPICETSQSSDFLIRS